MDNKPVNPTQKVTNVDKSLYIKIPLYKKVMYNCGDVANSCSWGFVAAFLVIFYTDVFKIDPKAITLMIFIARLWDGINDPLVGILADKTHTRWGKYRPWILFSMVPLGICTVLTFWAHPNFSPAGKITYAFITYFMLSLFNTTSSVPHASLVSVLTQDPVERSKLAGMRMAFAFIGNTIVSVLVIMLVPALGHGDPVKGYVGTAAIMGLVIACPLFLLDFFGTKEVVVPQNEKESYKIGEQLKASLKNKYLLLGMIGIAIAGLTHTMRNSSVMYYFTYVIGDPGRAKPYMMMLNIPFAVGAVVSAYISKLLKNKGKTEMYSSLLGGVVMIINYFVTPIAAPVLFYALTIISGFCTGVQGGTIFSIIPDTVEYQTLLTKHRAAGFVQSYSTFWNTIGIAVGSAGLAFMLSLLGYVPNVEQTPLVITGIKCVLFLLPGIITICNGLLFTTYKLDFDTFDNIVGQCQMMLKDEV